MTPFVTPHNSFDNVCPPASATPGRSWRSHNRFKRVALAVGLAIFVSVIWSLFGATPSAAHGEEDFTLTDVLTGLHVPTAVEVAPNGDVFVIEKKGMLKAFDGLGDTTADVVVDWRSRTMQTGDQGMLGLAVDPQYGSGRNYVYVHYVLDEIPGENNPPHWGDSCPDSQNTGCVVTATLARVEVDPATNSFVGSTELLTSHACFQFNGHSANDLAFGPDGYLHVIVGDGASFTVADYGQLGGNPCEDPPHPAVPQPADSEGGALRSMDLLTSVGGEANDPVWYNGVALRIDPDTGDPAPDNPLMSEGVAGDDRIIAHGMRNPWRMDFRPGTDELWISDVGWAEWEEINVVADVNDGIVENFGWPCYEGPELHAIYSSYGMCQTLINNPGSFDLTTQLTNARFPYDHGDAVGTCAGGSSAVGAMAFGAAQSPYPDEYDGVLFFSDYARGCLFAMLADANGVPDPATIDTIATNEIIVDVDVTASGELLVVGVGDFSDGSGTIRRLDFIGDNQPPTAVIEANTLVGMENVTVFEFDGSGSSDPEGEPLTFEWDLDGDGQIDETGETADIVYSAPGSYVVTLRVTDPDGASGVATVTANVSNTPPTPTIVTPEQATTWRVGDEISFSGTATDAEDGDLAPDTPGQEWEWLLILHHCPDNDCHQHIEATWNGVDSGSFFTPDHEYPSWLELVLTVRDSTGSAASTSVELQPVTTVITFDTEPSGLELVAGVAGAPQTTPFQIEAIEGGSVSVVAPTPQTVGGQSHVFESWSDGLDRIHDVVVPAADTTITATFTGVAGGEGFQATWQGPTPAAPWSYLWNQGGPLGDAAGYVPLQWNGTYYNSDGQPGLPSNDEFAYGSVQSWGVHPGRGTQQGSADARHAIIRYTAPQAGLYSITGSTIQNVGCPSESVDLVVLVNDSIVSTLELSGPAAGSFDQQLSVLATGDTIDVAVGPGPYDHCDATELDFFLTVADPPTGGVIADYMDDFSGGSPGPGWAYLWNETAPLGDSSGYSPLQWNSVYYDSDGIASGPSDDPSSYARVANWGVHPGRSVGQGAGFDRHVILRYVAPEAGSHTIVGSEVFDVGCQGTGVDISVLVDDELVLSLFGVGGDPIGFDTELGYLPSGATIDVAIGPGASDVCDAVAVDFSIERSAASAQETVAEYSGQMTGPQPFGNWSYLWNQNSAIGDPSGYTPLVWTGSLYDSDGQPGPLSGDDFVYGLVARWGMHPGRGTNQNVAEDRFGIARWTVPSDGVYTIAESEVVDRGCPSAGFELQVRVNNVLELSLLLDSESPRTSFDMTLGALAAGDTIDVGVGPDGSHVCDAVDLDYIITRSAS